MGDIVPIHKSGPRDSVMNYRPISLTSVCCKTLEHIIYTNIFTHLQNNSFFVPYQHGFRAGHSCVTQLVEFTHDIFTSFDKGLRTDCILLDFQKAFDKVSHVLLLHKLSLLGLPDNILFWLKNYLTGRLQRVVINGAESEYACVSSGVPQGSVLGPLLFLIYINDIGTGITSKIRLYADDCVLYREINNDSDRVALHTDLNKISSWCDRWLMSLNISKCKHICFTRKRQPIGTQYCLNGSPLSETSEAKYLGVTFSADLTWNRHVQSITLKAGRVLNFIKRNFKHAPIDVKRTLYLSNVRPILEYASVVWDPHTQILVNSLERIQKRAARFITGIYSFQSSVTEIKRHICLEDLSLRRVVSRLSFLRDAVFNRTPLNKKTYLQSPTYISGRRDHLLKIKEMCARPTTY